MKMIELLEEKFFEYGPNVRTGELWHKVNELIEQHNSQLEDDEDDCVATCQEIALLRAQVKRADDLASALEDVIALVEITDSIDDSKYYLTNNRLELAKQALANYKRGGVCKN